MGQGWSLAIDFGTSNTAAAHTNPVSGAIETVSLTHESHTIASHVYAITRSSFTTDSTALNQAEQDPEGFIPAPKRHIHDNTIVVRGENISVPTVISAVLREVISRASRQHNNQPPSHLTLTHPEQWSSTEINKLRTAAILAGIPEGNISLMSEAKAAVFYYTAANDLRPGEKIAVFDFGGGTLDIAVLTAAADGSFQVIAHEGNNALGGRSFDAQIKQWLFYQLENSDPDLLDYIRDEATSSERIALDAQIQNVKELLTDNAAATIAIHCGGGQAYVQLTRGEFNSIIAPQLQEATSLARNVLQNAGVYAPSDLKALYLTGGSSRVPAVQETLKNLGPVRIDNPKTVVSLGALKASEEKLRAAEQAAAVGAVQEPVAAGAASESGAVSSAQPAAIAQPDESVQQASAGAASDNDGSGVDSSKRYKWLAGGLAAVLVGIGLFKLGGAGDEAVVSQPSSEVPVSSSAAPASSSAATPVSSSAAASSSGVEVPAFTKPLREINKDTLLSDVSKNIYNNLRIEDCKEIESTEQEPYSVLCPFKKEISAGLTVDNEDLQFRVAYLGEEASKKARELVDGQKDDNYGEEMDPSRVYQKTYLGEDGTDPFGRMVTNKNNRYFYEAFSPVVGLRYSFFAYLSPDGYRLMWHRLNGNASS